MTVDIYIDNLLIRFPSEKIIEKKKKGEITSPERI
jgi:hypothetical protein